MSSTSLAESGGSVGGSVELGQSKMAITGFLHTWVEE